MEGLNELNMLFVDDDEMIRESMTYVFGKKMKQFRSVRAAEAGLEILKDESVQWDIVISDFQLPGMDGIDFLKHVMEKQPHVLTIMVTGYGRSETVEAAAEAGVDGFIEKPFTPDTIVGLIHQLLGRVENEKTAVVPMGLRLGIDVKDAWHERAERLISRISYQLDHHLKTFQGCAETGLRKAAADNEIATVFTGILENIEKVKSLNKELRSIGRYIG